ncbi:MAG: phosphate ABC transporter substrate-binding protein PstS family protein [Bacillus sp. (in: Bacteria)]|nr:phosphate ABC transporter substrate-binding protein PstS family protein [Bacillus sp. (in: firmicutes)]
MKKKYLLLITTALFMILLAACGDDTNSSEATSLEGTISMAGSTSVQPLSEELAAAFMDIHPNTRLEVAGGGSGAGVTAAQENAADFGAVSREIREDETGIKYYTIAIDGIAIIVNPDNPMTELTLEEVTNIFAGKITNWSEVGGENVDIVVVSREDGSGTRGAFTDIVLGDEELIESALIHNSTGGVLSAVAGDPYAIGYASVGAMSDTVKGLAIDGFEPTDDNIKSGDYTVSRPYNYAVNEEAELSNLAQAFLDFVLSEEGQAVVVENGYVSIN